MRILETVFFFFQAEDGIRDTSVTGVQTCALPIWSRRRASDQGNRLRALNRWLGVATNNQAEYHALIEGLKAVEGWKPDRSEERRVGKECRTQEKATHGKRKKNTRQRDK